MGTIKHWVGRCCIVASMAYVAATASLAMQGQALQNLRFVGDDGEFADLVGGSALPGGKLGTIRGEMSFASDKVDPTTGKYLVEPMRVIWRQELVGLGPVYVRTGSTEQQDQWGGLDAAIQAQVMSFDPWTGAGVAAIRIPVGPRATEGMIRRDYLYMPDGSVALYCHLGWSSKIGIDGNGAVVDELASASALFTVQWPDVWLGLLGGAEADMWSDHELSVFFPHGISGQRTLSLSVVPEGYASLSTTTLVVGPGSAEIQDVTIRPLLPGQFFVEARENGGIVGRTATISGAQHRNIFDVSAGQALRDSAEKQGRIGWPLYKECSPAYCDPPDANGYGRICSGCLSGNAGIQSCKGSVPLGNGSLPGLVIYHEGECSFDFTSACFLDYTQITCPGSYTFQSREVHVCGSEPPSLWHYILGGGSWQANKFTTCCWYVYDPNSPGTANVLSCH